MSIELVATTISDRTYEDIRADIIFGRLAPGLRLPLDRLAASYSASVSTLREILSRLSSEGLVIAEGQRGFQVAPISPEGFQDVAAMRLLLEQHALSMSFAAGDLEWESRVVAAYHKLATMERRMFAGQRDDTVQWKRYDREFHRTLIDACRSQTLLDLYDGVFDSYLRYQMIAVVYRGAAAAEEHRLLRDFALAHDTQPACKVLARHVNDCVTYTLQGSLLPEPHEAPAITKNRFAEQPLSIGESAYRKIRSDIVFGRLPPGRKLKLDALKADYGPSVSTLREILNRLASERLVVAEGQRGFEVAPVSVAQLQEIASLRQLLERHALEKSFRNGDMEWEGRVVAAHHRLARMEERMAQGDRSCIEEWKQYDWQFHQALISACGSPMLVESHAAVFDKYLRYQMLALSYRGEIAAREHLALLECALARDASAAGDVLSRHVGGGVEHALITGTLR